MPLNWDQGWFVYVREWVSEWLSVFSVIDEVCGRSKWQVLFVTSGLMESHSQVWPPEPCVGEIFRDRPFLLLHTQTHTDYFHVLWTNIREALGLLLFALAEVALLLKNNTPTVHLGRTEKVVQRAQRVCVCRIRVTSLNSFRSTNTRYKVSHLDTLTNARYNHHVKYVTFIWHLH